jgi:hypothetical protein
MDDRCEKELGELLESGDPVRPLRAGARSRALRAMQRSAAQGPTSSLLDRILGKGEKKMRRFAYVVAFLVLMGAAAGVFTRSAPPDPRSILVRAAEAMEDATSVRIVGHGCVGDPSSPSGMRMMSESYDMSWRYNTSERGVEWCMRNSGRKGLAYKIDLDKKEWRFYDRAAGICYRADITEVMSQAEVQVRAMRESAKKRLPAQPVKELDWLSDRQESVETETRDGRKIAIVTVTGMNSLTPEPLAERHVFEVDMATNHLLRSKRYVRAEGSEEQLLETVDLVDYDVPVPGPPEDAKIVTATARVQDLDVPNLGKYRSLQMVAPDGEIIVQSDQPR